MCNFRVSIIFIAIFIFTPLAKAQAGNNTLTGPYLAEIIKVIDGDTVSARIQLWLGQEIQTLVRIDGIDTPELKAKCPLEKQKAKKAKAHLAKILKNHNVTLHDIHYGKYAGRIVARIETSEGNDVAQLMINQNHARSYSGSKHRKSWC